MTALKKIYQKALPLFGASFSLIPSESISNRFSKLLNSPKDVTINAKLEKKSSTQKEQERKENPALENYKKSLNQTKVYLVVNKDSSQLCLLETYLRTENKPLRIMERFEYRLMNFTNDEKYNNSNPYLSDPRGPFGEYGRPPAPSYNAAPLVFQPLIDYESELAPEELDRLRITNKRARKGRFVLSQVAGSPAYFTSSKEAYKPICPVFFSLEDATEFLKDAQHDDIFEMSEEAEIMRSKTLEKTKIISLGLGDFMDYYSCRPHEKNKLDFLFMPDLEKGKYTKKTLGPSKEKIKANFNYMFGPKGDIIKPPFTDLIQRPALIEQVAYSKGFKDYEKEFQKYKEMN